MSDWSHVRTALGEGKMVLPKIVLIGGPPHLGKLEVASFLAPSTVVEVNSNWPYPPDVPTPAAVRMWLEDQVDELSGELEDQIRKAHARSGPTTIVSAGITPTLIAHERSWDLKGGIVVEKGHDVLLRQLRAHWQWFSKLRLIDQGDVVAGYQNRSRDLYAAASSLRVGVVSASPQEEVAEHFTYVMLNPS